MREIPEAKDKHFQVPFALYSRNRRSYNYWFSAYLGQVGLAPCLPGREPLCNKTLREQNPR